MMDLYLLLTPLLILGLVNLIRFVGCDVVFGLDEVRPDLYPVDDLAATAADRRVHLSWDYPSNNPDVFRIDVSGGPFDAFDPIVGSAREADITGLTNGLVYTFTVTAEKNEYAGDPRSVSAAPGVTSFIIDQPPISGTTRNNYGGWLGIEFRTGPAPITITQLGRIVAPGNSGMHEVKIASPVTAPAGAPVDAVDVISVMVQTIAALDGSNVGTFAWAPLAQPQPLAANTTYFLVSLEMNGGDVFYEERMLQTTNVGALTFSTVVRLTDPDVGKYQRGQAGFGYVPVSFRY